MTKVQNKGKKIKFEYLIIIILVLLALFIFFSNFGESSIMNSNNYSLNEKGDIELKINDTLSKIEGVGKSLVLLSEDNDNVTGVVVVCEGANDLRVKLVITEVITTILGVSSDNIRILKMK